MKKDHDGEHPMEHTLSLDINKETFVKANRVRMAKYMEINYPWINGDVKNDKGDKLIFFFFQ